MGLSSDFLGFILLISYQSNENIHILQGISKVTIVEGNFARFLWTTEFNAFAIKREASAKS